jgi:hypothetical protein
MKNSSIILLNIAIFISSNCVVLAQELPKINISDISINLHQNSPYTNKNSIVPLAIPYDHLGMTNEKILEYFNYDFIKKKEILDKKYKILLFKSKELSRIYGIYFIRNNINEGYIIFDHLYWNQEIVEKIKEVTKESNHFKNKLKVPKNVKVKVYENKEDKFVERYIIAEKGNHFYLLLDSFYPKKLEKEVEDYIIEQVNKNLNYMKE